MTKTTTALLAALTLAVGCGKKADKDGDATVTPAVDPATPTTPDPSAPKPVTPDPAVDPAPPPVGTPPEGGAAGEAPAGAAAEIPTEQDFEEAAGKDITDKNVEAEVKKLEKELGK